MKKGLTTLLTSALVLLLAGCDISDTETKVQTQTANSLASAQLGNLANADVKIYRIEENGSLIHLWSETTSDGEALEDIGRFDLHDTEVSAYSFYLYEVRKGEDWDSDDDGIKDINSTRNEGVIRAVARGSDIQALKDNFRVTAVTELVYGMVAKNLKYNFFDVASFGSALDQATRTIVETDIDGNGIIDIKDALSYDPVTNLDALVPAYRDSMRDIVQKIHAGKSPFPDSYTILDTLDTNESFRAVALSLDGTQAYVAASGDGLLVIDVSNPTNIKRVGSFDTAGMAIDVAVSPDGAKVYVADENNGLVVIDVTNSTNPAKVGYFNTIGPANAVATQTRSSDGEVIFIIDNSGDITGSLVSLAINGSTDPVKIGSTDLTDFNFPGYGEDLALSKDGTKAFAAVDAGLIVIDVREPENPTKIGSFDTNGTANGVAISNDDKRVYLADSRDGLLIIDVSNPADPKQLGRLDYGGNPQKVALSKDNKRAYIADYSGGVIVVDVSDPANPKYIETLDIGRFSRDVTLSSDDSKAYITTDEGLTIVDLALFK